MQAEEDNTCPGCGQPRDEAWHPGAQGRYTTRNLVCHACAEVDLAEDDIRTGDAPPLPGLRIIPVKT